MGLDLIFYEIKTEDKKSKYEKEKKYIEEVMYLSNSRAMLIVNWLYRNDDAKLTGNYLKLCDIYHHIYGHKLEHIYKALKKVREVNENKKIGNDSMVLFDTNKRDIYALHYFPCLHSVDDWVNSTEMFSQEYYNDLDLLYKAFDELLHGDGAKYSDEREFLYQISW